MGVTVEVDQTYKCIDEKLANQILRVDVSVNALPYADTAEAVRGWIDLADFRHLPPRNFREVVRTAIVRLIELGLIDYSECMHDITIARFGKNQGEKFASSFDCMLKAKEA